jgi:ribosomal protein S18 acetylase RimI-like enzyme
MTSETPAIQRATLDDHESIARLHFLSHTVSFAPFASERWLESRQLSEYVSRWRETLDPAVQGGLTLVARLAGAVVGMVRVARSAAPEPDANDGEIAELTGMHVKPGLIGQSIGTLLMERSLDYIREQNFSRVVLGVIAANTIARRFYEGHGWILVEERPDGVEGVPVVVYELA